MKVKSAVVVGTSAGGLNALQRIVRYLPSNYMPIIVVQHLREDSDNLLPAILANFTKMKTKEACADEKIQSGIIYIAPPGYHLQIEKDFTFSLSFEEKINQSRPAIDVLFETASEAYKDELIGVLLTGSNSDGAAGLKKIKENGGLTIVQDPKTAESSYMPESAINLFEVDYVLKLEKIGLLLKKLRN